MGKELEFSGIYAIKNKINGYMYIGQSKNINIRWINHRSRLNNNKHANQKLQNAWNEYGQDNFEFIVIEKCDQDIIDDREIFWIDYYNSTNRYHGYNLSTGGEATSKGIHLSDEQKEKMSKLWNPDMIVQLDFDGELVHIWRSASHASRSLNIRASSIIKCAKHDGIYQVNNYIWLYKDEYDRCGFNIVEYKLSHAASFDLKIKQIDLYGNIIKIWDNFLEIKNKNKDMLVSMIGECCNHNRLTYKGYIWIYDIDNFKLNDRHLLECRINTGLYKVEQYDNRGNFIRKWTVEQIQESDYQLCTIRQNCTGKSKTAYNYIWKYEGDASRVIDKYFCEEAFSKLPRKKKKVYQYDLSNKHLVNTFSSLNKTKEQGYEYHQVRNCCMGLQESYMGYIWSYEELVG